MLFSIGGQRLSKAGRLRSCILLLPFFHFGFRIYGQAETKVVRVLPSADPYLVDGFRLPVSLWA